MLSSRLAAWFYTHPRARRVWLLFQLLWGGSLIALLTAPAALADTISGALAWTGLHDSYQIPIGAYYVSVVPMTEAISAQGVSFGVDPGSWGPALMSTLGTALTYTQLAGWLGVQCALFLFVCSLGIWFIKFALGATWLSWLAAVANPIVANMQALVTRLNIMPGAMTICAAIGGIIALTKGMGLGLGIIAGGLMIGCLSSLLLQDPVSEMVSDNGVLGIGKSLGFMTAQGLVNNGPLATGGGAQLETLTSWLCDVLVRDMIQLINFGQVIDDVPGCAGMWNAALVTRQPSGPALAMKSCGAQSAYYHATELDTTTVGLFAALIVVIGVVLFALDYIGAEVFRVGFRAFWNLLVIVPAAAIAVAPGPPRQFAKRTALKLVVHGVEMIAATAGLGIVVLLMALITRGSLPGAIGMTAPMAKLVVMLLIAVFGAIGFRYLLKAFGDQGLPGPARITRSVINTTTRAHTAIATADSAVGAAADLRSRAQGRSAASPGHGQAEHGGKGPAAPGRRPHPSTRPDDRSSSTRPPNSRTTAGDQGERPGGVGQRFDRTPTATAPSGGGKSRGEATKSAPDRGAVRSATKAAAAVVAPEVLAGAVGKKAAAGAMTHLAAKGARTSDQAPGRRSGAAVPNTTSARQDSASTPSSVGMPVAAPVRSAPASIGGPLDPPGRTQPPPNA